MKTIAETFKIAFLLLFLAQTISLGSNELTRPERGKSRVVNTSTTESNSITPNKLILKGRIKCPIEWDSTPEFRIIFEGKQTVSDNEGFYSFNLENWKLDKFRILICKNLHQNFDNINTIENLKLIPEKTYKYYSFKKIINDKNKITWTQTKKTLDNKNFILPKNCLVILINPKYVADVKNWDINLSNNFIALPQITLKDSYPEKKIRREAAKSLLRSIDISTFHEKTDKQTKYVQSNVQLSLAQN